MNRRQALRCLGAVSLAARSGPAQTPERDFLKRHPAFDLHCHPGMFAMRGSPGYAGDGAFVKTTSEMREGGLAGGFFALVADARILARDTSGKVLTARPFAKGEAWADCEKQLQSFEELAKGNKVGLATSVGQMEDLRKRGQLAAILSCEGGDCLEGNVEHVDDLYRHGVRSLQLVHYAQNNLGDSQTNPPVYHGISPFGRDVVRRMNRLGMAVDVAHASFEAVKATVDAASAPLLLTHTHLQSQTSPHPRLITVEHAKLVASTAG